MQAVSEQKKVAPVLVTGAHRSGTTWVGRMLALSGQLGYIHEPFNLSGVGPKLPSIGHWFEHVDDDHPLAEQLRRELAAVLAWQWSILPGLASRKNVRDRAELLSRYLDFRISGHKQRAPLIKDPIALYSADWICRVFQARVVICIRHPAAFCQSVCQKNWTFDFRHLLAQTGLREILTPFWQDIEAFSREERPLLDQAVLLWNCAHHQIRLYRESHDDWIFVRNEDLSRDPVPAFRAIYAQLGLRFDTKVEQKLRHSTELTKGALKKTVRDSRANVKKWQGRLTSSEIARIRTGTADVSRFFYSESDW